MQINQSFLSISNRFLLIFFLLITGTLPCLTSSVLIGQSIKESNLDAKSGAWNAVGAGGGGAMFYPTISPFNNKVAFVSCDMTGSFVTLNGGESWRMFNLRGPVHYYVFDPLDSNTVYAKSIGLFKSMDRGNTWRLVYPHPSEIKGVVSKGDHAEERIVTDDNSTREVLAFAIDPANSSRLFAAISINKSVAFYSSSNSGGKWVKEMDLDNAPQKIYVDPASPKNSRSIYVAGTKGIIQKINGVWKSYPTPKGVKGITEFSGGYDGQLKKIIIYAISGKSYFNSKGDQSGIYFTDNGGRSWQNRQEGIRQFSTDSNAIPEWRTIATSALHPEVLYVSYAGLKIAKDTMCIGVAKSSDYGKTWQLVWQDLLTKAGGISSSNFSKDWLNDRYGPSWGENPFSIGVSPTNPGICLTTDFGRTVKTINGGKSWEQVYSTQKNTGWKSRGLQVTTPYDVVFDPFDRSHVFIANSDIGLLESTDSAVSWVSATQNNGVPDKWVNSCYSLAFDPSVKGRAWAAMSDVHDLPRPKMFRKNGTIGFKGGIVQTDDAGKTWQAISATIGEAAITHLLVDPASPKEARTIYACAFGKGVYKSIDGGITWVQKNKGIEGKEPFAWQIIYREKDHAMFVIISRRSEDGSYGNEYDGAIYKSLDGAESWTKITLPEGTNAPTSLIINQQYPNKLKMSAWGRVTKKRFSRDTGGGIFLSEDEGKTWKQVLAKEQHINDLSIDTRNNRLYACGFNGSAYYSVNDGNDWIRIKGFNFKWGRKAIPDPDDVEKIFITTFGGGVWHGPASGDQSALDDIVTPLFAR